MITGSAGNEQCGVGDYAYELAQHLALDAEVHLFYAAGHGPTKPPFPRLTTFHLRELKGFSLLALRGLASELSGGGYDIVHLQYPSKGYGTSLGPAFLPQQLAGMNSRSRIVLTLHEWFTSHPLRKLVMDQMLPAADAVIVSNEREMTALAGRVHGRTAMTMPIGNVLRSQAELDAVWLAAEGRSAPELLPPSGPSGRVPYSIFHYGLPARGKGFSRLLDALKLTREVGRPAMLYLGGEFRPGEPLTEELLNKITELGLADAVVRLGHIPREELEATVQRYTLGAFPFDEGFSSKRSSIASISHCDLPLAVGGGSAEEHPYYAPNENTAAALSVLLVELFSGRLAQEWTEQVNRQRDYAARFSFTAITEAHIQLYQRLRRVDV